MRILAELLDAVLQLPGGVRTVSSPGCFMPMRDVKIFLWTDPGGVKNLFSTQGEF